jgi:hypothetical protein
MANNVIANIKKSMAIDETNPSPFARWLNSQDPIGKLEAAVKRSHSNYNEMQAMDFLSDISDVKKIPISVLDLAAVNGFNTLLKKYVERYGETAEIHVINQPRINVCQKGGTGKAAEDYDKRIPIVQKEPVTLKVNKKLYDDMPSLVDSYDSDDDMPPLEPIPEAEESDSEKPESISMSKSMRKLPPLMMNLVTSVLENCRVRLDPDGKSRIDTLLFNNITELFSDIAAPLPASEFIELVSYLVDHCGYVPSRTLLHTFLLNNDCLETHRFLVALNNSYNVSLHDATRAILKNYGHYLKK